MASLCCKPYFGGPLIAARGVVWQFHSFDQDYLRRLASADPIVEHHFSSYFGDLLVLKLRARIRSPQLIEDVRQETLLRVLRIVREGRVEHPERFGAFVSGVCSNVLMEFLRGEMHRRGSVPEFEPADDRVDLEKPLVNQQRRRVVERVLEQMPGRDRELLRMFFLEERDKSELCKHFKVGEDYLRLLLHRAKSRFRAIHSKQTVAPMPSLPTARSSCAGSTGNGEGVLPVR
jgi:RNA polymerase sigma-70 factor (ECF subfamily)